MASQDLYHHGDSLCSSDFTAENASCLPTYSNTSETARYFKPFIFHSLGFVWTECKWCQSYYLLHKMFPSQGQIRGRKYGNVPQVPQGQLATLFLDPKHLHFSKAGPFQKRCLEVINILLTYHGFENLEMSSFSLRPSWICEPSYWWVMRSFTLDYTPGVWAIQ